MGRIALICVEASAGIRELPGQHRRVEFRAGRLSGGVAPVEWRGGVWVGQRAPARDPKSGAPVPVLIAAARKSAPVYRPAASTHRLVITICWAACAADRCSGGNMPYQRPAGRGTSVTLCRYRRKPLEQGSNVGTATQRRRRRLRYCRSVARLAVRGCCWRAAMRFPRRNSGHCHDDRRS